MLPYKLSNPKEYIQTHTVHTDTLCLFNKHRAGGVNEQRKETLSWEEQFHYFPVSVVPGLTNQWFMPAAPHSAKRQHTIFHQLTHMQETRWTHSHAVATMNGTQMIKKTTKIFKDCMHAQEHRPSLAVQTSTWDEDSHVQIICRLLIINIRFTWINNKHVFIFPTKTDAAAPAKQRPACCRFSRTFVFIRKKKHY